MSTICNDLSNINFGKIDAGLYPELTTRFDVVSVPTIFIIKANKVWKYREKLNNKNHLIKYIQYDHINDNTVPLWSNGLGIIGITRGYLVGFGIKFMKFINLKENFNINIPEWFGIYVILFSFGLLIFLLFYIHLCLTVQKENNDHKKND